MLNNKWEPQIGGLRLWKGLAVDGGEGSRVFHELRLQ